jgi:hypothetical protein
VVDRFEIHCIPRKERFDILVLSTDFHHPFKSSITQIFSQLLPREVHLFHRLMVEVVHPHPHHVRR